MSLALELDGPESSRAAGPKKPRSLTEAVLHKLRSEIVQGVLAAGSKLLIDDLQRRYDVSGGTVREALSLLVSDGLVQTKAQRGFFVMPMSLDDLGDLTRARIALECEAVRESVKNGGSGWEDNLRAAYLSLTELDEQVMRDPEGQFDRWEIANRNFHRALIAADSSNWTYKFLAVLNIHLERYRRLSSVHTLPDRDVLAEHEVIFQSAMERDADRCAQLLREHIGTSAAVIRKFSLIR